MDTQFYKNGFPVETPQARQFWASRHRNNRFKAIIAFSVDKEDALRNMRRRGYPRGVRNKAWEAFGQYVRDPDMLNIPFSNPSVPYWHWQ